MKETTNLKLSKWVFWQPLKFSALLFLTVSILTFLYSGFFALRGTSAPMIPFTILLIFVLIYCIARLIKKLPSSEMDRTSFIAIHNAQKTVYFFCILLSSIFFIDNTRELITSLLFMQTAPSPSTMILLTILTIFFLYTLGLAFSNLYAEFRRIKKLGIPTYKIILSIPFGFSALWIPGYFIADNDAKKTLPRIQTKWYQNFTKWVISNAKNCIISFIVINIIFTLIFNINAALLTTSFALLFGIWLQQVGQKKFTQNIHRAYTNMAIITNIAIILAVVLFSLIAPEVAPDAQINITETATTLTQGLPQ